MITVMKDGDNDSITMSIRRPTVYLDHWALRYFSSDQPNRNRFLSIFKNCGTLFFSWANVIEVSLNTGLSAEQIRSFLSEIDEQWCPITMDPVEVIEREKRYKPGNDDPSFDIDFMMTYYPYIHDGSLSLSKIVELTQDDLEKPEPGSIHALTTEISQLVGSIRDQWRLNPQFVSDVFSDIPFDPDRPMQFTYNRLMRLICKETFRFTNNDALDFCHAAVSLAYGDFVLLDKRWVSLAEKLGLPADRVRVYSKRHIDQFLCDLEQV